MQATLQPTPAQPPAPPAPPGAGASASNAAPVAAGAQPAQAADVAPVAPATPRTAAEVAGLQARTAELRDQLRSAQRRRADLARDQRHADPTERAQLEGLTTLIDDHIASLRSEIASNEQLVSAARPGVTATVQLGDGFVLLGPNGPSPNAVPLLLLVVVLLQVLILLRARARRPAAPPPDPLLRESAARLARVEQAVDAIAVEVERVSEGQRFVSRLLGEQHAPATRPASTPRPQRHTPV